MIRDIILWTPKLLSRLTLAESLVDAPQFLKDGQEVSVLMNTETDHQ